MEKFFLNVLLGSIVTVAVCGAALTVHLTYKFFMVLL